MLRIQRNFTTALTLAVVLAFFATATALARMGLRMGHDLLQLTRFRIDDQTHGAGQVLPWHTHDAPLLSLVLEGRYEEVYPRRHFHCGPFDLVLEPGGERHHDRVGDKGARSLLVALSTPHDPEMERFVNSFSEPRIVSDPRARHLVRRTAREWRVRDELTSLALEAALLELIVSLARATPRGKPLPGGPPRWLARVDELIRDTFRRSIILDELANECGVHPAHLARAFRKWRGCSIGEYVRALRVEAAVRTLTETDVPLSEIALSTGFYDQSHMGRALRRSLGATPLEIRRRRGRCQ